MPALVKLIDTETGQELVRDAITAAEAVENGRGRFQLAGKPLEVAARAGERQKLERRLLELKIARGEATLDGQAFSGDALMKETETALAALADADAAHVKREASQRRTLNRARFDEKLKGLRVETTRRIDAAGRAEKALHTFATELNAVLAANAAEAAHVSDLRAMLGGKGDDLNLRHLEGRLGDHIKSVLSRATGMRSLGPLDLNVAGGYVAGDSWASGEARQDSGERFFAKHLLSEEPAPTDELA
jgi:hypothetical protein